MRACLVFDIGVIEKDVYLVIAELFVDEKSPNDSAYFEGIFKREFILCCPIESTNANYALKKCHKRVESNYQITHNSPRDIAKAFKAEYNNLTSTYSHVTLVTNSNYSDVYRFLNKANVPTLALDRSNNWINTYDR